MSRESISVAEEDRGGPALEVPPELVLHFTSNSREELFSKSFFEKKDASLKKAKENLLEAKTFFAQALSYEEGMNSLGSGEAVPRILAELPTTHHIEHYKKAEASFVEVLKPFLSKPIMKDRYVRIEDFKEEILDSIYHLGLIYLRNASREYLDNYSKAAAIFQYCESFKQKYNISTETPLGGRNYTKEAHLCEKKFLESLGKGEMTLSAEALLLPPEDQEVFYHITKEEEYNTHKRDLRNIRDKMTARVTAISDFTMERIAERADHVQKMYIEATGFFANEEGGGLVQRLISDCKRLLGPVPEDCEYSIVGLGSLAGGKMAPWSDLEFAIIIAEDASPEAREYFRNLTKLLHIKIINFGETTLRSVGVESLNNFQTGEERDDWFWDEFITSGFSFDGPQWHACKTPLGRQGGFKVKKTIKHEDTGREEVVVEVKPDFELIMTPSEMLEFQKEYNKDPNTFVSSKGEVLFREEDLLDSEAEEYMVLGYQKAIMQQTQSWFESDRHMVQSLRNVSLIDGTQGLLDHYRGGIKKIDAINPAIPQKRFLSILAEDVDKFELKLGDKEEGKLLDIKKSIYRIADRIIESLSNYYGIQADPAEKTLMAWDAIIKLHDIGVLSDEGAGHLKEALAIATELRMATYCHNNGQKESASSYIPAVKHISEERRKELIQETFHIKDPNLLHHFYYVVLRLQKLTKVFCNDNILFQNIGKFVLHCDKLFDNSNIVKGQILARFLDYNQSIIFLEAALEDDPQNLYLLSYLNILYHKTARTDDMVTISRKIARLCEIKSGDINDNLKQAIVFNNLGIALSEEGNYTEALVHLERALELRLRFYYPQTYHQDISNSYQNIGNLHIKRGLYSEGIAKLKQALIIMEMLPGFHANFAAANCYSNLASAQMHLGHHSDSIKNYTSALAIFKLAFQERPNHPNIAACYSNMGEVYARMNEDSKALEAHQKSLEIHKVIYSTTKEQPFIARNYLHIGNLYLRMEKYDEAIEYYLKAEEIQVEAGIIDNNPMDISAVYSNLGIAYGSVRDCENAIKYFSLALDIRKKFYLSSPNHPELAAAFQNLGMAYDLNSEYRKAIEAFNNALKIYMQINVVQPQNLSISKVYKFIADSYFGSGDFVQSEESARKAVEVLNSTPASTYLSKARSTHNASLAQLAFEALLQADEVSCRDYLARVDERYATIDLSSREFLAFIKKQIKYASKFDALNALINAQKVLSEKDSEMKYGNHYHNLACYYASDRQIELAYKTFLSALECEVKHDNLYVEFAHCLIMHGKKLLHKYYTEEALKSTISDNLYLVTRKENYDRRKLSYGNLEKDSVVEAI